MFIVIFLMLMFVFQMNIMAKSDKNSCLFTEYNCNDEYNGTNCISVKVVYPKKLGNEYLVTSTNLSAVGGGWYVDDKIILGVNDQDTQDTKKSSEWRIYYIMKDHNPYRFFAIMVDPIK
jgi:hypothetical protein